MLAVLATAAASCTRTRGASNDGAIVSSASPPPTPAAPAPAPAPAPPILEDAGATEPPKAPPSFEEIVDGPHEIPFVTGRTVYYALPKSEELDAGARPWRLVAHLHGVCGGPSYACGKWLAAGASVGAVVCPTGNAKCNDSPVGQPSWEAPTWSELLLAMDHDLEASIAKVEAKHKGSFRRDGAVLTGYSRGAYAAAPIARTHPGRWPYLVLIEANVPISADSLGKSGVRAVALVAGERSEELAGERKTEAALVKAGFPAKLFVMPGTGHAYADMERIMSEALAFVLAH